MPKGYAGRILRVNLTENSLETEEPPDSFYRRYVGGNGFVGYYLLREVPRGADPLGPDNLLIFAAGPITGVPVAGAGRHAVGGKSPLTGGYGEADVGGFFGAEMKHAGFDAILITGRSQETVYLWVHDGEAEICSADHLWGMSTLDCHHAIQAELGDHRVRIAAIGRGGERLVRYACVIHDLKHAAGRTGMGAVMGSKNLKAVAIRGKAAVAVADPEAVKGLGKWMAQHWKETSWSLSLHDTGTSGGVEDLDAIGAFRKPALLYELSVTPLRRESAVFDIVADGQKTVVDCYFVAALHTPNLLFRRSTTRCPGRQQAHRD